MGSIGGMEQALVERAGLPIKLISVTGVRGKNPVAAAKSLWTMRRGYTESGQLIRQFQPDALFVTGGYVCVPVTLAAHRAGVPALIYLPDVEPGMAIKFLARFVTRVAVTTPASQHFFKPGQAVVTGYPVRPELAASHQQPDSQAAARQELGLTGEGPVLLVFGGSRGAHSLNQAIAGQVEQYLPVCRIVHITGSLDIEWVQARRAALSPEQRARYYVWPYLHEQMTAALLAADLVVSRAGASVMGEFPAAGLPAILVPYPYAGAHQTLNANYLAQNGAGVIINDADLAAKLALTVLDILIGEQKLAAMRRASLALAKPDAAERLAQQIVEVATYAA